MCKSRKRVRSCARHRYIRAGRAAPRSALYVAAMNAVRFNPVLRSFYERRLARTTSPGWD